MSTVQEKAQLLSGDRSGDFTVVTEDGRDIDITASEIQADAEVGMIWNIMIPLYAATVSTLIC